MTVVVGLAGVLALVPSQFRVTADATLEGRVQRAIVASVDGFISQVEASAGDVVKKGQILARLDDGDLRLEHRRWEGRRSQLQKEHREALATHDRSRMSILGARIAQANAQVELLEASLARTELTAPFHGVVVRGDLSQSLGSPVEKGAVLFELAPLEGYRVFLEVDERDISNIRSGQHGELKLSAMPRSALAFTVDRVTPVATAAEGRNVFRVEANLEDPSPSLRPGMAGIAKIDIQERSLLWIWTHDMIDRLRLWVWMWRP
jgi:RND family efflux transporter MFP subunit